MAFGIVKLIGAKLRGTNLSGNNEGKLLQINQGTDGDNLWEVK